MAEFIREDSMPIVTDMLPNEIRTSNQASEEFSNTHQQLTVLPLRIDTAGRDVAVGWVVEQFSGGRWVEIAESYPRLLEPDNFAHAGTLRLRIRVKAGPLGAIGDFDAGMLIVVLPELGSGEISAAAQRV